MELTMKHSENKPVRQPDNAYAAFAGHKVSRKEKYAWIAAVVAVVVLLLSWWARSSQ
jgi:hypothetical protein